MQYLDKRNPGRIHSSIHTWTSRYMLPNSKIINASLLLENSIQMLGLLILDQFTQPQIPQYPSQYMPSRMRIRVRRVLIYQWMNNTLKRLYFLRTKTEQHRLHQLTRKRILTI